MKLILATILIAASSGSALATPSAEDLFDQGQTAFNRRDWQAAIAKWQRAYDVSGVPGVLYSVAQAWRLSGDCPRALSVYKRFIELDPTSVKRDLADGFVAELSTQCGAPSPPAEKSAHAGHDLKLAGFVTGGAGVALFATGLLLGWRASSLGDEVTTHCKTTCDWSVERAKQRDGRRDESIGIGLDVFGLAAIAVGAGFYVYGAIREGSVTVQPHGDGATLSWSGQW